jgi:hypothetical protein
MQVVLVQEGNCTLEGARNHYILYLQRTFATNTGMHRSKARQVRLGDIPHASLHVDHRLKNRVRNRVLAIDHFKEIPNPTTLKINMMCWNFRARQINAVLAEQRQLQKSMCNGTQG